MKFETYQPEHTISPKLKDAAIEAAKSLSLAASLEDTAELFGQALRGDKSKPLAEDVLALRDEYRERARKIVRDYLNPAPAEPFTGPHVRTTNLEVSR